jgi:hypothetical protein
MLVVVRVLGQARHSKTTHVAVHGTLSCTSSRTPAVLPSAHPRQPYPPLFSRLFHQFKFTKANIHIYIRHKYKSTHHVNHSTLWCIISSIEISLIYPGSWQLTSARWWHLAGNCEREEIFSQQAANVWVQCCRQHQASVGESLIAPEIFVKLTGGGPT